MALKDALRWEKLSVDQKNAATREFAAQNRVTIDEARLALAGTKQQAQSVGARERSIVDMVKVLAATPVYYRKTPEELRAMAVAAVGAGGTGDGTACGSTAMPFIASFSLLTRAGVVMSACLLSLLCGCVDMCA